MRRILALVLLASVTAPASAAEHGAPAGEHGAPAVKAGAPGTNIEMPFLMAPLLNAEGKLFGYAYLATRLTAKSDAFASEVRLKLAFVQDAFVRDLNGRAVTKADDLEAVDIPGVEARLLANAKRIVGPAKVVGLTICTVQIALLRPQPVTAAPDVAETGKHPPKSRCEA